MSETIEIIFENINIDSAFKSIIELAESRQNLVSAEILALKNPPKIDTSNFNETKLFLKNQSEVTLFLNLNSIKTEKFTIEKPSLMLKKYTNDLSLFIIFDKNNLITNSPNASFASHLKDWALDYKSKIKADSTFCGLEPATDFDTRFFTDDSLGPLI